MRKFPFQIFSSTTHAPMSGQASNITVMLSKDGTTPVLATNPVTEVGTSYYTIQLTDSELNCTDFVEIDITCPGADKRQFAFMEYGNGVTAKGVWEYGTRSLTQYQASDIAPSPAGSVYCTRGDVERRWGINNVKIWADIENDGDAAKIATQISWAILSASSRINDDLSTSGYSLPFDPLPNVVRRYAAVLAGIELYNTRAINISAESVNPGVKGALENYNNWISSILSNMPIEGAVRH